MEFTSQELLTILDTKDGIFDTKKESDLKEGIIPLASLEQAFQLERARIKQLARNDLHRDDLPIGDDLPIDDDKLVKFIRSISFDMPPLPIKRFIDNLKELKQELATLTHLAIYYGLTPSGQMILIMQGVQLDGSEGGVKLREKPKSATRNQFTTANLSLTKTSNREARRLFKSAFRFIHGKDKFVFGTYIRIGPLLDRLNDLLEEDCELLQTTLAYLEPAPDLATDNKRDLKCFHLIFRGLKANGLPTSNRLYSTYDHEEGYSGPKPSCPPFGAPED